MNMKLKLLSGASMIALVAVGFPPAFAQTAPTTTTAPAAGPAGTTSGTGSAEVVQMGAYVVTGFRGALASADEIKESNLQVVDSIVASDVNKLPDVDVSYALSRVPGIQVAHTFAGLGGNGAVTIHGLTQVANTLDGREIFTPGGASGGGIAAGQRTFDFSQIPSALIAGIDVYKTSAANQIDGGLGGLIDVRMRRPFDFGEGLQAGATVGTTFSGLDNQTRPNYNLFASETGKIPGVGKLGVLVSGSFNTTPWREDNIGVGNPTPSAVVATSVPTALMATGYNLAASWGEFQTNGFNAEIQWQPFDHLSLYAGANHEQWSNIEQQVSMLIGWSAANAVAGSGTMFPGSTTAVQTATVANVTGTSYSVIRDLHDRSTMAYVGGDWTSGDLTLNFDLNRYVAAYSFYDNGIYGPAAIPSLTYDISGTVPTASVAGASLSDPSIYKAQQVINRLYPSQAWSTAGKIDADYNVKQGMLTKILAGVRYSETDQNNSNLGLFLGAYNIPAAQQPISNFPGLFGPSPIQNFFTPYRELQPQQYLSSTQFNTFRNVAAMLAMFGAPSSVTPQNDGTVNPLGFFDIKETTTAAYLMPQFAGNVGGLPFDGNIGFRVVQTKEDLAGFQKLTNTSTGVSTTTPLTINTSYTDWLPSLNYRIKLTDKLFLRLAASKTITRPPFSSMSPGLTLNQNPINANANSGSQGNPNLKPIRSTNYDVSIEDYLNKDSVVYLAGFYKDVTGFIASITQPETFDGVTYAISTSANLNPATIKGAEAGYHQFFTFLPQPFDGLGLQANYTIVESSTPSTIQGYNIPLTNLSRTSYNVVLMYEKGPFSARVAYNWRDKYVTGVSNFVNVGLLQQVVRAYGDLDASLNYNLTKNIQLSVQGVNLTNSLRYQFWGTPQFPSNAYTDGMTLLASVSYRY
ncbi:MAG TPA: TonB-dependent receptor [Opitutaceae bacterium]|nr:TonB-dependent receptor [Opitutaceae bacterium]